MQLLKQVQKQPVQNLQSLQQSSEISFTSIFNRGNNLFQSCLIRALPSLTHSLPPPLSLFAPEFEWNIWGFIAKPGLKPKRRCRRRRRRQRRHNRQFWSHCRCCCCCCWWCCCSNASLKRWWIQQEDVGKVGTQFFFCLVNEEWNEKRWILRRERSYFYSKMGFKRYRPYGFEIFNWSPDDDDDDDDVERQL